MGGGDEDHNHEEKKVEVEEVNMMKEEEGEEDYEGLLQAKAKRCLWFDQLQRFIPVQTLYPYAVPRIICIGEESSGKSRRCLSSQLIGIFAHECQLNFE